MSVALLPYVIPLSFGVLLSIITAYYVWRRSGSEGIVSIIILLASAEWLFGYIMEIVTQTLAVKIFWNQVQYVGSSILISGLIILALQSTGYDRWITKRNIFLWNIIPATGLVFIFTNAWHGLFWPYHGLEVHHGIMWLTHPHGSVYYIFILYVYLVILSVSVLLLRTIFHKLFRYLMKML